MVSGAVVFGPVVGSVVDSGTPVVSELSLGVATTKPVKTHVHGFCASWLDVVVDDPARSCIVCLNGRLGLFVAHFCEELAHWNCFACVDVQCS